jgi:hypothetical protein
VVFAILINGKLRFKICVHDIVFLYNKFSKNHKGNPKETQVIAGTRQRMLNDIQTKTQYGKLMNNMDLIKTGGEPRCS